jgi:hypothetical protein
MVRMLKPALRTIDTRTARPPEKKVILSYSRLSIEPGAPRSSGYRCGAIEDGKSCTVSAPAHLFADHIVATMLTSQLAEHKLHVAETYITRWAFESSGTR